MNIHKHIEGEGAELYLPFALSRIQQFARMKVGTLRIEKYRFGETVVDISYDPFCGQHHVFIRSVDPAVPNYEFVTTTGETRDVLGYPVEEKLITGVEFPKKKATKVWQTPDLSTLTPSGYLVADSALSPAVNAQGNAQHFWWPLDYGVDPREQIRTKGYFVTSTLGGSSYGYEPYDDQGMLTFTSTDATGQTIEGTVDIGPDVPYSIYEGARVLRVGTMPEAPHWWRRGAVQEVEGRKFVIMTDMQSNFRVVPIEYATTGEDFLIPRHVGRFIPASSFIPAGGTDKVAVPGLDTMTDMKRPYGYGFGSVVLQIPDWVGWDEQFNRAINYDEYDVAPGADPTQQHQKHHYRWAFNGDATKAVAVVHRNKNNGYADLTVPNVINEERLSGILPTEHVPFRRLKGYIPNVHIQPTTQVNHAGVIAELGGLGSAEICERSVLEVSIDIEITGDELEDFTANVSVVRHITGAWFVGADYAFHDQRLIDKGVDVDNLITSEIKLYARTPLRTSITSQFRNNTWASSAFRLIRNQDTDQTVMSFCFNKNRTFYIQTSLASCSRFSGPVSVITNRFVENTMFSTDPAKRSTLLDLEDLRSLSFNWVRSVTASYYSGTVVTAATHTISWGEVVDRSPEIESLLGYTEAQSAADNAGAAIPATFIPPAVFTYNPFSMQLPASDISTGYALGLYRTLQEEGLNLTLSDVVGTAIEPVRHPDGHAAWVTHDVVSPSKYAISDHIRYRSVRKTVVDGAPQYEESIVKASHIAAVKAAFGLADNDDDFAKANDLGSLEDGKFLLRLGGFKNTGPKKVKSYSVSNLNPDFED